MGQFARGSNMCYQWWVCECVNDTCPDLQRLFYLFRFIERYSEQWSRTFTIGYSYPRCRSPFGNKILIFLHFSSQILHSISVTQLCICTPSNLLSAKKFKFLFFPWILFFRFEILHKNHTLRWMTSKLSTKKI